MSACPSGCGRQVSAGKLLCGPCWSEVPAHLQREVYRTWRAYFKASGAMGMDGAKMASVRKLRLDYQAARDAALGSIK